MTDPRTPEEARPEDPAQPGPGAIPPPPAGPDPVRPPVSWEPTAGSPPSGSSGKRRALTALAIAGGLLLGSAGWRVVSEQARPFFGSTFTDDRVWGRIPADARDEFERRLEASAGDLRSMPGEEASRQAAMRVAAGMPRLDDTVLVRRLTIQTAALGRVDEATCGLFAQESFAGRPPSDDVSITIVAAMTDAELIEWFDIVVLALEADAGKSPAVRSVSEADTNAAFERLFGSADSAILEQIQTGAAPGASAADACLGVRALYDAIERASDPDRRLIALADVTP